MADVNRLHAVGMRTGRVAGAEGSRASRTERVAVAEEEVGEARIQTMAGMGAGGGPAGATAGGHRTAKESWSRFRRRTLRQTSSREKPL